MIVIKGGLPFKLLYLFNHCTLVVGQRKTPVLPENNSSSKYISVSES